MTEVNKVLSVNLPAHNECKLCKQKLGVTMPRTVRPREGASAAISREPRIKDPALQIEFQAEKARAFQSPAYNHRLGEIVWVLDPKTCPQLKLSPNFDLSVIHQRKYIAGMIVGVPPTPINWEQFQNAHPKEGKYRVQILKADPMDREKAVVEAHFTNVFPHVFKPGKSFIDEDSNMGANLPSSTASFIVLRCHNNDHDIESQISTDVPIGYASESHLGENLKVLDGVFAGPEKVWQTDVVNIVNTSPTDDIPMNDDLASSSVEPAYQLLHISQIQISVDHEKWDSQGGAYQRTLVLRIGGDAYEHDPSASPLSKVTPLVPAYFKNHEQVRKQGQKIVPVNHYIHRYYEPEAVKYWTQRHGLTLDNAPISQIVPDRGELYFQDPRMVLDEYRCRPSDIGKRVPMEPVAREARASSSKASTSQIVPPAPQAPALVWSPPPPNQTFPQMGQFDSEQPMLRVCTSFGQSTVPMPMLFISPQQFIPSTSNPVISARQSTLPMVMPYVQEPKFTPPMPLPYGSFGYPVNSAFVPFPQVEQNNLLTFVPFSGMEQTNFAAASSFCPTEQTMPPTIIPYETMQQFELAAPSPDAQTEQATSEGPTFSTQPERMDIDPQLEQMFNNSQSQKENFDPQSSLMNIDPRLRPTNIGSQEPLTDIDPLLQQMGTSNDNMPTHTMPQELEDILAEQDKDWRYQWEWSDSDLENLISHSDIEE